MSSEVVFIKDEQSLFAYLPEKFERAYPSRGSIAVKMHMGEPGNAHFIRPELARKICNILEDIGCNPFVFDTPVVYSSPRNNVQGYLKSAASHGFTEDAIGAPVVVSDSGVRVKGKLSEYNIAEVPIQADGVLLLSHVKGHIACGMGGAIKNVGMGCMSKETKGAIHTGGEPRYESGCIQCDACAENCPTRNIRIDEERPFFDRTWCPGCSNCAIVCPEKCILPRVALFDELLSEAASLAESRFKKLFAINVLMNIAKLCDCIADSGPIIAPDIGFICGGDMVSVDAASLETIAAVTGKQDVFAEYNIRSPWGHVRAAARHTGRDLEVTVISKP
jgi:uncharacterized Fe-S center protein